MRPRVNTPVLHTPVLHTPVLHTPVLHTPGLHTLVHDKPSYWTLVFGDRHAEDQHA